MIVKKVFAWYVTICLLAFIFLSIFGSLLFDEGTLKIIGGIVVVSLAIYIRWFYYWDRKFNFSADYDEEEEPTYQQNDKMISLTDFIKRRDS